MTAWNAFSKAADDADAKETTRCNALPTDMKERPNFVDRLSREEDFMKARIERIEAVKPTLTAFYNTLTAEQKVVLDRPRGMMGREGHRHAVRGNSKVTPPPSHGGGAREVGGGGRPHGRPPKFQI